MTPFAATTSYKLTELSAREQEADCLGIVNVAVISWVEAENWIVAFTVSTTNNKARCSLYGDVAVMDMCHRSQNQCVAVADLQRCALIFNDNDLGFHSKASSKLFLRDLGDVAIERNRRFWKSGFQLLQRRQAATLVTAASCLSFSSFKKLLLFTLRMFSLIKCTELSETFPEGFFWVYTNDQWLHLPPTPPTSLSFSLRLSA